MPPTPTAANVSAIITLLCSVIARHGLARGLAGPLIVQIWQRVRHAGTQVEALLARLQAGTLRRHRQRRPTAPRAAPRRRPTPAPLPRKRGWLIALVPETAGGASQLQHLLAGPDIPTLLEAAPQLRRALRPLCHGLGVRLPSAPQPTPEPQTAAPPTAPTPPGKPPRAAPRPRRETRHPAPSPPSRTGHDRRKPALRPPRRCDSVSANASMANEP